MKRKSLTVSIVAVAVALAMCGLARAATITVNTTNDPSTAGQCGLRDAINAANEQAAVNGCVAGSGNNDTIAFGSGVTGTIALSSSLPATASGETLTITGPTTSPGITISGGNAVQLMVVNSGATLTLQFLTLENGSVTGPTGSPGGGGAISNNGTLTVANSTLSGNQAQGGPSGGGVPGGDGSGGAIGNGGTLTVTNSTLSGNQAAGGGSTGRGNGGAISNGGTATITNSTLSGNQAVGGGGPGGFGAAISNGGTVTITNSTLSGNGTATIGGGVIDNDGGTVTLKGTILAAGGGGNCGGSTVIDGGYNISDDSTCGFGTSTGSNGKIIGDNVNPLLDPNGLLNNGGATQTIALQPNSPAIDAVPISNCPSADQRGQPRPDPADAGASNLACDAGAYETQAVGAWPMFGNNVRHSGLSPYDTTSNNGNLRWSFTAGGQVAVTPAIAADGTIYEGSGDDNLYAISFNSSLKWKFQAAGALFSSPAIGSDGTIYVASSFPVSQMYAINPDGSQKWAYTLSSFVFSSPSIGRDGTVYFGANNNNLYALNSDGSLKWTFPTNGEIQSSPAIGPDGTIYFGSFDDNLYAVNPDGTEKWMFTTSGVIQASPAIGVDGTVYVGSFDEYFYAINPDGSQKWKFKTGDSISDCPALGADGTVYVGSLDDNLYAINPDGSQKWKFLTRYEVNAAPAIGGDGTIYLGAADDNVYAINPDGSQKWKFSTNGQAESPAIGADGTVYVGSTSTTLYALGSSIPLPTATATATATPTATATATSTPTATATPTATPTTSMSVTSALAFGNVAIGQTSTKTVTITNTGASHALSVGSVTPSDPEYSLSGTGTCGAIPITVAPKTNCTLGVSFTPSFVGAHPATLAVSDNASTSPQHVTLSGTGIAGLSLTKTSLTYKSERFGLTGVASLAVVNHQTQTASLSESFTGANPSDFSLGAGTCSSTLAPQKSCSIIVDFKPGVLGTESATLAVSDTPDPQSPYNVTLSTAPTIPDTVLPATLSFGTVSQAKSKTLNATITNYSPYALSIGSGVTGTNGPDFTITGGTCGASLSGNSSCTIAVTFKPTTASGESATLGVTVSNDPDSPHSVALTGTGS